MSVVSTSSRMCASMSSRLTAPSDNPRENAKPADVVAIALNRRCCRYLAVPMSHGFGIAKQPLSWSPRNFLRLFSLVAILQSGEKLTAEKVNGARGARDIEGKATRVGASETGKRTSFNPKNPLNYLTSQPLNV